MCKFPISTAHALARKAIYGFIPPLVPAGAADDFSKVSGIAVSASLLAGFSLAIACCCWAWSERARLSTFRRSTRNESGVARTAIGLRDAVIRECVGNLVISGPNLPKPLAFGAASAMLESCEAGPDSALLSAAREQLVEAGQEFSLTARTNDNRAVAVRGKPVGGHAVLLVDADVSATTQQPPQLATGPAQKDLLDGLSAALNSVGEAVAIFGADCRLVYHNDAYTQLWSLPKAWLVTGPVLAQILDRLRETQKLPEQRNFAAWKAAQLDKFTQDESCIEELWHLPGRKNVRVVSQRRPNGGLMLFFQDVTEQLDLRSALAARAKVQKAAIEMYPDGVAIFGADGRLRCCNSAFSRLWNLPSHRLFGEPHMSRIAEDCIDQFGHDGAWDLVSMGIASAAFEQQRDPIEVRRSDGRIISVQFKRLPDGSTFVGFADTTDQSRLEAALHETAA